LAALERQLEEEERLGQDEQVSEGAPGQEEEAAPAAPRRKPGRKPKRDTGPYSLADVVNSPDSNDAWWQEHRLVIYRKDVSKDMKALMKADSGRTWIDRISGPFSEEFDESYLRAHYGGGLFTVFLQEKPTGGNKWDALMEAEYVIAGPPRYTDEEAAAARRANPNAQPQFASGIGEPRSETGALLELLRDQIKRADAPQAVALQSFAETLRAGQQVSNDMLMTTMRQVMELRAPGNNGQSDKLLEMLLGMIKDRGEKPVETKSSMDQLREMVEMQRLVRELSPRRESGPMDKLAETLLARATENMLTGAGGGIAGALAPAAEGASEGWVTSLVKSLAEKLPQILTAGQQMLAAQHRNQIERLDREFRYRQALIAQQRGQALTPGAVEVPLPAADAAPTDEQIQQRAQQEQQIREAAQMEQFINSLTQMFFADEDAQDAAITLNAAFPQIMQGLRVQLAQYPQWWSNPLVIGYLRSTYPAMTPVLTHPNFGTWISRVWAEFDQAEKEATVGEGEAEAGA